ncbi:hypothetical protein C7B65_26275 [Phormidesmis priestleyi ULC007]|uniref:Uncharacterized protein n=1 Tax=Phormidesmis priestleyi ULC007 TaxID=1920490 RepID=A0A2T1D240_9CYAN|nr:hypothetical protein [Phormidesmis priestleyi]PSB14557.1 hypothetical protein C7B65_26275 [Phormidesmis priestleyi ULC007]PZO50032.1 MAG: hypothetical protein DCF14_12910 [Phormidesmis priestleyi]
MFDPRGDIRSAQFIRELIKFGFEVAKVNPIVTTTGETVISEFINMLLRGGDGRKAQGGLNQFFEGVKTPGDRIKLLEFADRLVQAAQLLQGADLQVQKKDARFLSQLLNLGGAYAALGTQVSQSDLHFFLETLRQSQDIQKAATELKAFLDSFNGDDQQLLAGSRNLLQTLSLVPSQSIRSESRNPSVAKAWLDEAAFHASLRLSLNPGERILDASGLYDDIWNASSIQKLKTLAEALYAYAAPEGVQVASNGDSGMIAQKLDTWGNSNPIGGTITLIGGLIYIIIDEGGKIIRAVYHSNSGEDERTAEEKATDDAINEILVGATLTDRKGKPLPNGTNRKEGDVENYDKPTGEEGQAEDLEKLSRKAGGPIKTTEDGAKTADLIDGGSVGAYPEAKSTGGATTQINTRPKKSPMRRTIKIRYTHNRRATIVIPTV